MAIVYVPDIPTPKNLKDSNLSPTPHKALWLSNRLLLIGALQESVDMMEYMAQIKNIYCKSEKGGREKNNYIQKKGCFERRRVRRPPFFWDSQDGTLLSFWVLFFCVPYDNNYEYNGPYNGE